MAVYTELINEFTFYSICSCLYFFCPGQDNYELKEYIGWLMIGITILNVLINFTIVIFCTIKGIRSKYQKYKYDKYLEKQMSKKYMHAHPTLNIFKSHKDRIRAKYIRKHPHGEKDF